MIEKNVANVRQVSQTCVGNKILLEFFTIGDILRTKFKDLVDKNICIVK